MYNHLLNAMVWETSKFFGGNNRHYWKKKGRMSSDSYSARSSISKFNNFNNGSGVDWVELEAKFKEFVNYLNEPVAESLPGSDLARQREMHRKNLKRNLECIVDIALGETTALIQTGDYKKAIVAGLKLLSFVQKLYGTNSLEQIEAYFLLAKANQNLKRYREAEEFLSIASWTVIKNKDVASHIKAKLHLNFGLVYVMEGNLEKAKEHLARNVYYLALMYGIDHLITSFGYFNLGKVFLKQGKSDKAFDFFRKVVDIWYSQLIKNITKEDNEKAQEQEKESSNKDMEKKSLLRSRLEGKAVIENSLEGLEEEKIYEADSMFEYIMNIELEKYGENYLETGKTFILYGLYQYWVGEVIKSKEYLERGHKIYRNLLGDKHAQAREISDINNRIISQIST
jgi:tetratricopeptide (TPR) repeat protein